MVLYGRVLPRIVQSCECEGLGNAKSGNFDGTAEDSQAKTHAALHFLLLVTDEPSSSSNHTPYGFHQSERSAFITTSFRTEHIANVASLPLRTRTPTTHIVRHHGRGASILGEDSRKPCRIICRLSFYQKLKLSAFTRHHRGHDKYSHNPRV